MMPPKPAIDVVELFDGVSSSMSSLVGNSARIDASS
jgi:hypothetical protein